MLHNYLKLINTGFLSLTILLLFSCHGSPGAIIADFGKYSGYSPDNVEITAGHHLSSETLQGFKEITEEFNKTNSYGIKVRLQKSGGNYEYDMIFCGPSEASSLLRDDSSIELSPLISHPVWGIKGGRSIFYPQAVKQSDYWDFSRRVTSIPLLMTADLLLVNTEVFKNHGYKGIPRSWFMMNLMLHNLNKKIDMPVLGLDPGAASITAFINARGGSVNGFGGFNYNLTNPSLNRSLRYIKRLKRKKIIALNSTKYVNQTDFAFGRLPIVFTGINGLKYYHELITLTDPEMQWHAALMPSRQPGDTITVNCTCSAAIINNGIERQLASWLFIKWLTEEEQQYKLAEKTFYIPAVRSTVKKMISEMPQDFIPQWLEAVELIDGSNMKGLSSLPNYQKFSVMFESLIDRCVLGENWIWLETTKMENDIKKRVQ